VITEKKFKRGKGFQIQTHLNGLRILVTLDRDSLLVLMRPPKEHDEGRQKTIWYLPYRDIHDFFNTSAVKNIFCPGQEALIVLDFRSQMIDMPEYADILQQGIMFKNQGT
jgi:hypothetical protein